MKFVALDLNNLPVGFYDDSRHSPEQIPASAVKITEEQWLEFINNSGLRKWDSSLNTVVEYIKPFNIDTAQKNKLVEMETARETAINQPIICNALGSEHKYNATSKDRQNLNDQITLGQGGFATCTNVATNIKQRTAHSHEQLFSVAGKMALDIQAQHVLYATKVDEIKAATTQANLDAVIW